MAESEVRESKPLPDPTILTTEQLLREVGHVQSLLETQVKCMIELSEERKGRIDELTSIREKHRLEIKGDTNKALEAALKAQQDAVVQQNSYYGEQLKSLAESTKESINKLAELFTTSNKAIADKVDDVKERVGQIESRKEGATENKTQTQDSTRLMIAFAALVTTIVLFVMGYFISRNTNRTEAPQVVTVTVPK